MQEVPSILSVCDKEVDTHLSVEHLVIITGYSGAGKQTVLRALEDAGFYCVDNLPVSMLNYFIKTMKALPLKQIALVVDSRGIHNIDQLILQLEIIKSIVNRCTLIFVSSSAQILYRRFQETRRRHPLAIKTDLAHAIEKEQQLFSPIASIADIVLKTDEFTIHDLRAAVTKLFADQSTNLMVTILSFGFKYGVPLESNFVFDVRNLPNPYFVSSLREYNGTQQEIKDYLFSQDYVNEFIYKFADFFQFIVSQAQKDKRTFLQIAIGCTGGRHRSVAVVEQLAQQSIEGITFLIKHRDIDQDIQRRKKNENK